MPLSSVIAVNQVCNCVFCDSALALNFSLDTTSWRLRWRFESNCILWVSGVRSRVVRGWFTIGNASVGTLRTHYASCVIDLVCRWLLLFACTLGTGWSIVGGDHLFSLGNACCTATCVSCTSCFIASVSSPLPVSLIATTQSAIDTMTLLACVMVGRVMCFW